MGASVSKTSIDLITEAVANISVEIVQQSINTNNQNIVVSVSDTSGNVTISNVNTTQNANIRTAALFKSLSETENNLKVNEQLNQLAKSIVSGLNIGQLSASVSKVKSIIKNTIELKNKGVYECSINSDQNFQIKVEKTRGNVIIKDINVNQISKTISDCIVNAQNLAKLRTDTDIKIKQVSEAKSEGLDFKWIAIAVAAFLGVSFTVGKEILGPLLIAGGIGLYFYMKKKKDQDKDQDNNLESSFYYLSEDLDKYLNLTKIKEQIISESKNPKFYGEADFYEIYKNKIILYRSNSEDNSLEKIKSDYKEKIKFSNVILDNNNVKFSVYSKNSKVNEQINVLFNKPVKNYIMNKEPEVDTVEINSLDLDNGNINFRFKYLEDNSTIEKIEYKTEELNPTLIYKKKSSTEDNKLEDFLLNYSGIGIAVLGVILTLKT